MTTLNEPIQLGDLTISVVSDGTFRLDGGTMFGIVPKALWERLIKPDAQNRIEIGLNCLLIRSPRGVTLVEAGIGRDFPPRKKAIYAIDDRTHLLSELQRQGLQPEDIGRLILTHLHFDHCGWCTREVNGQFAPTFPQARYIVQSAAWEDAHNPTEFSRGGYLPERLDPIREHRLLDLVNGQTQLDDAITLLPSPSHARGHQCVQIRAGGRTIFCPGDLLPTRHHLRLPYIMAYDRDPEGVIQAKKAILQDALAGDWILFLCHDPQTPLIRLEKTSDGVAARPFSAEGR